MKRIYKIVFNSCKDCPHYKYGHSQLYKEFCTCKLLNISTKDYVIDFKKPNKEMEKELKDWFKNKCKLTIDKPTAKQYTKQVEINKPKTKEEALEFLFSTGMYTKTGRLKRAIKNSDYLYSPKG